MAEQAFSASVTVNPGCAADRGQTGCRNLSQTSPPSSLEPGASRPPLTPQCTAALSLAGLLDEYLTAQASLPFDWATHNCCHFVGGWVREVEGVDPMASMPEMASKHEALRLLRSLGGLPAAVTRHLRRAPVAPGLVRVGDVVAMPLERLGGKPGRHSLGICVGLGAATGELVAVFQAEAGCVFWPTLDAQHAWRVPQTPAP